jgi:cytochrome c-type biogenesis protein CcsB
MKSKNFNLFFILYSLIMLLLAGFSFVKFNHYMDIYEKGILIGTPFVLIYIAYLFQPFARLILATFILAMLGISAYHGNLDMAQKSFLLKYFLSSQTAIMWMTFCIFSSMLSYWIGLWKSSSFVYKCASKFVSIAIVMGTAGMLVRWFESYLISVDVGHIPISNLYEVFVLFCLITLLIYSYYEYNYKTPSLGAFVLPIIASANAFLVWYAMRGAHEIQPLVPALQSWWMKIHVPANFIGYGTFALAAMLGCAYLIRFRYENKLNSTTNTAIDTNNSSSKKHMFAEKLPNTKIIDDIMYKAIALGFAFFTLATILGALWAAEAWGGYWSWDPKEVWALIVWLNYAAWLHMRLISGWRGNVLAWWAIIGLFITTFAFMGVNMFLSGLHSYGTL